MKTRTFTLVLFAVLSLGVGVTAFGQSDSKIANMTVGGNGVRWDAQISHAGGTLTISAPDGRIFRQEFRAGGAIQINLSDKQFDNLPDGVYNYELQFAPALSAVVAKCLERNPQDRYSNLHELSLALTQVSGRSASAVDVKGRWFARRIWKTTAVIFLLLVLASAVGIWRFRPRKTEAIHAPVTVLISDFENNTSESIFDGTLEPAFSLAMEGAPFISTYSSGAAHKLAAQLHPGATRIDAGLGKLIAIREGLHDLITGSISRRAGR